MRITLPQTTEERIKILQGLVQLRKDGHFHEIYATDTTIRIKKTPTSRQEFLSWRRAKIMVTTAMEAAAKAAEQETAPIRKPPTSEAPQRALTASASSSK